MDWLTKRYCRSSPVGRTIIRAFFAAFVFYGGSLLEQQMQGSARGQLSALAIASVTLFILFTFYVACSFALQAKRAALERADNEKQRQLRYASSLMDQFVADQIRSLSVDNWNSLSKEERARRLFASTDRLYEIVRAVYRLFESHFGSIENSGERIDFEVTFMTKSYLDDKITIPAYANRAGRAPISLNKRKEDPDIYADSMTAMVYKSDRPEMRVIEDTVRPNEHYSELYPGQKERIKSSIIYPVLDEDNKLLGTLVVHCDRQGFFRAADRTHWRELLEVFARRLALEKVRIDIAVTQSFLWETPLTLPKPF